LIRSRILRVAVAGGMAAGVFALAAPAGADLDGAKPDNQIVVCSGGTQIASLNPTIKSGTAKYVKAAIKGSDGTKVEYLTALPVPADALSCFVDSGIATDDPSLDGGTGKYNLDNQTAGQTFLDLTPGPGDPYTGKESGSFVGSSTCDAASTGVGYDYPASYPLQGKLIWKFAQDDAAAKQIQIQQYVRTGRDSLDPNTQHVTVDGMVIKGPGLGADSHSTFDFWPTTSTKNIDVLDCAGAPPLGTASLAELRIAAADGSDADAVADTWDISLPS
jgi:hypothetical protein